MVDDGSWQKPKSAVATCWHGLLCCSLWWKQGGYYKNMIYAKSVEKTAEYNEMKKI